MSNTKTLIIESPKHGTFEVLYDAEDEDKINKHTWGICKDLWNVYVRTSIPHPSGGWYISPGGKRQRRQTSLHLHRLIMNTPKGMQTDHINGDPLDNRKENLRICTVAENAWNRGASKNNKSGFKGVKRCGGSWYEGTIKWMASINFEGKRMHLGVYDIPEEAARAYDAKAIELHGEFAQTNFPIEDYANIALQLL